MSWAYASCGRRVPGNVAVCRCGAKPPAKIGSEPASERPSWLTSALVVFPALGGVVVRSVLVQPCGSDLARARANGCCTWRRRPTARRSISCRAPSRWIRPACDAARRTSACSSRPDDPIGSLSHGNARRHTRPHHAGGRARRSVRQPGQRDFRRRGYASDQRSCRRGQQLCDDSWHRGARRCPRAWRQGRGRSTSRS